VSVYRDWINYTISKNTLDYDIELLNMPNNLDMNNDLEIWWDTDVDNHAKYYLVPMTNLISFCLFLLFLTKYK
ncbi:unnamed protein product, partial [Adineta steineri]